jgi:hypothetical protein
MIATSLNPQNLRRYKYPSWEIRYFIGVLAIG